MALFLVMPLRKRLLPGKDYAEFVNMVFKDEFC